MLPNIKQPQFIVLGMTGVARGKKANTKSGHKKQRLAMLMAMP
jgi:hypothetical protein